MASENRLIKAVHTITGVLSATVDLEEGLKRTLQVAMETAGAIGGSIYTHDPQTHRLVFRHLVGEKADELKGMSIGDAQGIAGRVFQCRQASIDNDVAQNPDHAHQIDDSLKNKTLTMLTVPICYSEDHAVGIIQLVNKQSGEFTEEDLMVLEIVASISAMSIRNADLAQQAQKSSVLHYLGDLAHDIKNKTAPITMGVQTLEPLLSELLAQQPESDQMRYLKDDIEFALSTINISAEDVRRYTQFIADTIKGKSIDPQIEPHDLIEAIDRQLNSLEPAARRYGVMLERSLDQSLICSFDRFLIERAVYNLVNNALPETKQGGSIKVSAWTEDGFAVIEVRDTGRGMPRHILEGILSGNATSTKPGGTGLGTMIVKRVAELHHGLFEGESQENVGTAFRIRLPLSRENEGAKTAVRTVS